MGKIFSKFDTNPQKHKSGCFKEKEYPIGTPTYSNIQMQNYISSKLIVNFWKSMMKKLLKSARKENKTESQISLKYKS